MKRPLLTITLLLVLINAASLFWFTRHPIEPKTLTEITHPKQVARLQLFEAPQPAPPEQVTRPRTIRPEEPTAPKPPAVIASTATPAAKGPPPESDTTETHPFVTQQPQVFCFITPPFTTSAASKTTIMAALANNPKVTVTTQNEQTQSRMSYWVRLPARYSQTEAIDAIKKLETQGIKDIAPTPGKNQDVIISLGLFRHAEAAAHRQDAIRALGHEPQLVTLTNTSLTHQYLIHIPALDRTQASKQLQPFLKQFPQHQPEPQDCPVHADLPQ